MFGSAGGREAWRQASVKASARTAGFFSSEKGGVGAVGVEMNEGSSSFIFIAKM
jgi:hypothetical protein